MKDKTCVVFSETLNESGYVTSIICSYDDRIMAERDVIWAIEQFDGLVLNIKNDLIKGDSEIYKKIINIFVHLGWCAFSAPGAKNFHQTKFRFVEIPSKR